MSADLLNVIDVCFPVIYWRFDASTPTRADLGPGTWLVLFTCFVFFCFLASHIEWKQRESDRKAQAASLIASDCLVCLPRPCPPISPVIYAGLDKAGAALPWRGIVCIQSCWSAMWAPSLSSTLFCWWTACFCGPQTLAPGCVIGPV